MLHTQAGRLLARCRDLANNLGLCRSFGETEERAARGDSQAPVRGRQAVARGLQHSENGTREGHWGPLLPLFTKNPPEPNLATPARSQDRQNRLFPTNWATNDMECACSRGWQEQRWGKETCDEPRLLLRSFAAGEPFGRAPSCGGTPEAGLGVVVADRPASAAFGRAHRLLMSATHGWRWLDRKRRPHAFGQPHS